MRGGGLVAKQMDGICFSQRRKRSPENQTGFLNGKEAKQRFFVVQ
jgi:hypothetical protein